MKKTLVLIILLTFVKLMSAQVPQGFKYQAVARDASGTLLTNQELNFEIIILKGSPFGEVVYAEQHRDTTNQFGLVTLNIGMGNITEGDFPTIDWSNDAYFLAIEINGIFMGASQLLSVPYALYAREVLNDKTEDEDADPLNEIQNLSLEGTSLSLSLEGGTVEIPGDDWGNQVIISDLPLSGEGTNEKPLTISDNSIDNTKIADGTIIDTDLADHVVTIPKLPEGATSETFLRGDGVWATPPSGGSETDPTWNGDPNTTGNIWRSGNTGIGVTSPAALLHAKGIGKGEGNILFEGEYKYPDAGDPPAVGEGTRMMWYADRGAFRAGYVNADQWNAPNIGHFSIATGYSTKASGYNSTAIGVRANATGDFSTAFGNTVTASGKYSLSTGTGSSASGDASTAMGVFTHASSFCETVVGSYNTSYVPASKLSWNLSDRLFVIGNGTSNGTQSNAMTILKNGYTGLGTDNPAAGLHIKSHNWPGSFIYLQSDKTFDAGFRIYEGEDAMWHIFNDGSAGALKIDNSSAKNVLFIKNSDGNVGIGTTSPSYKLQVGNAGDGTEARANAWNTLSDERLKRDFYPLVDPLDKILRIQGYSFLWNDQDEENRQLGFNAQEVKKVLPELVSEGEDGYLSIKYGNIAPVLVEAIKELKKQNDELLRRIEALEKK